MAVQEIIRLENVSVTYETKTVLDKVSISVEDNDFLGIIGPNGGGKTTLFKVILGLIKPDSGKVTVMGKAPDRMRHRIGYVPQYNLFDREFPINVMDTVLMGCNSTTGLFKRYKAENRERAIEALKTVGMEAYKERQIGKLSGGEQQRVFIARALVSHPKLLLLDEPTASVDSSMQTGFYELLVRLKEDMTIVMISHDISAVSVYVDKIACLNKQLYYHGSSELEADVLEAAYNCPVQMIVHGHIPHRVLKEHG